MNIGSKYASSSMSWVAKKGDCVLPAQRLFTNTYNVKKQLRLLHPFSRALIGCTQTNLLRGNEVSQVYSPVHMMDGRQSLPSLHKKYLNPTSTRTGLAITCFQFLMLFLLNHVTQTIPSFSNSLSSPHKTVSLTYPTSKLVISCPSL